MSTQRPPRCFHGVRRVAHRAAAPGRTLRRVLVALALLGAPTVTCALPGVTVDDGVRCPVCMRETCAAQRDACDASAACKPLAACLEPCSHADPSCALRCYADHPGAGAEGDALAACRTVDCAAQCETCGGLTSIFQIPACDACLVESCCAEATACAGEAECIAQFGCMNGCKDPACFDQCLAVSYKGGNGDPLIECALASCREECRLGLDYECAGDYRWPDTDGEPMQIAERLMEQVSQTPLPGVLFTPCGRALSDDCVVPGVSEPAKTGADGVVVYTVPSVEVLGKKSQGFDGYVLVTGPAEDEEQTELYPALVYRGRPEYRSRTEIPALSLFPKKQFIDIALLGATKKPADPTRGHIFGAMFDCHGLFQIPASGLRVEADTVEGDGETHVFYLRSTGSISVLDPDLEATTDRGQFAVLDLPPANPTNLTFTDVETGDVVATAHVLVKPGHLVFMGVYPDPAR